MKPTYYIATGLPNAAKHREVRALMGDDFELTYDWTTHGSVQALGRDVIAKTAKAELDGVISADFIIVLLPGGAGTHTELGAALALGKRVYIYSERPVLEQERVCAFHLHPLVEEFQSIPKMVAWIRAAQGNLAVWAKVRQAHRHMALAALLIDDASKDGSVESMAGSFGHAFDSLASSERAVQGIEDFLLSRMEQGLESIIQKL